MAKRVLITGASSGIGEATARHFSSLGYEVVLVARSRDKLEKLSRELPSKSLVVPSDLTDLEKIGDIFEQCRENGFLLDGMVHSAGISKSMPVRSNDIDLMKNIMTLNYFSFMELGKYFYSKKYSSEGGSILAVSSISSKTCYPGTTNYAASKASVNIAVQTMSKEFMKRKIRVNAILPANVETPMVINESTLDKPEKYQPLGLIDIECIARTIEFFMSEKARYITGAEIPVSAGIRFIQ